MKARSLGEFAGIAAKMRLAGIPITEDADLPIRSFSRANRAA